MSDQHEGPAMMPPTLPNEPPPQPQDQDTPPPREPGPEENFAAQVMQMLMQSMHSQQQQSQAMLQQQAQFQYEMLESRTRVNQQKQKADPPKFNGRSGEDLELWLFHIKEHFSVYAIDRESNDSRFVHLVVPYLGPDVISWYREFKKSLGLQPRSWFLFKTHACQRFRDSDFENKL